MGNYGKFHHYYQWVALIFALQAAFFYLPRYLWSTWEGGRLGQLISELGKYIIFKYPDNYDYFVNL